ncbi:LysR family transcriptional regulator [Gordonibacter massiliensis (ex Traore et al. 2017)]|uniref:LysR family transcriptional regulator n=1 Tax=Gordonibacter massiliensis (ex Traore et al. 2017) TaxID=1841863 RepID=A0A842JF29_9ACTN|nr:LysR family transcriptional regulator [Gordonibacter massiliensis (ex Traore et al. 2017)]MBC2890044.1 LysR family transcriptional regulator [Gordonibacter massiliensis (ex Traore et al. 2017)]
MDAQAISYFISAYESGNLSKAANEHFITQQALSKNIVKLENELGVALFERTSKGVKPTEAGAVFYRYASKIASLSDEARHRTREAAGIERAKINVGMFQASMFTLIPKIAAHFAEQHPDIDLEFVDYTDILAMYQDVISGKVQAAPTGGNYHAREQGIRFVTVGFEPVLCAVPSDGPLAQRGSVRIEDLRGLAAQLPETGAMRWLDSLRQYIKEHEPEIDITVTGTGGGGTLKAMHEGFVAFGPASFCFALPNKTYVAFEPPKGMDPLMSIDVAVRSPDDPLVQAFCNAARQALQDGRMKD